MCGIAGFKVAKRVDGCVVERWSRRCVTVGRTPTAIYRDGDYQGGMRRLSIIDIAHGDQPLFNADGRVALLYNGEIYNYRELRRELEAKGHVFRTDSDGEVICHLYAASRRRPVRAARRHVRGGAVDRARAQAHAGARSAGREAALLRASHRRARWSSPRKSRR